MRKLKLGLAAILCSASFGLGSAIVSAIEVQEPRDIRTVEASELDYEGELAIAIYAVGYFGNFGIQTIENALLLGKNLSEIGSPGRNAQVAAALCAIYETPVESRRENFYDYYTSLTSLATLGEDAGGQYAGPIKEAIINATEADADAFSLYVLGVAAATNECQR
ncbi:MAG: hypothetical protein AB4050_01710 [Synechococcus sp.]